MKQRKIAFSFIAIVTAVAILFSACRKINESTELGGGLIPPVDNINTFDTLLTVQAYNDTFGLATDSLRLKGDEEHFLGKITNDPIFGQTDARMFFELKPSNFPFHFNNRKDSLYIDSVVMVLHYLETYGDTNAVQTVNVYELEQNNNFSFDTSLAGLIKRDGKYLVRKNDLTYNRLLGTKTFAPRFLKDSVKARGDTTAGQLRIRLDDSFGTRILNFDTLGTGAFKNDSLFRERIKGFALQSVGGGNAVMGFDLQGINTKLAIYYRHNKGGVNKFDTTVAYFRFNSQTSNPGPLSANANYVLRDYTGTPVQGALGGPLPDPIIYIQNSPGTFATLKIPDLASIGNRTIHRAELIVEQIYDISDSTFRPPDLLYLDAFDPTITGSNKFRTIPYDLTLDGSGALTLRQFGVLPVVKLDPSGRKIRTWHFNISRYVQHILTGTQKLYDLRLFAPLYVYNQFGLPPGPDELIRVDVNPAIIEGRVRLHGNNGSTDTNPQRVRLRLVYSKL